MKTLGDFTDNIPDYLTANSPAKQYGDIVMVQGEWMFFFFDAETGDVISSAVLSFDQVVTLCHKFAAYLKRYLPITPKQGSAAEQEDE